MKPPDSGTKPAARRSEVIVRWALGALLLIAGALKLAHPGDFFTNLLAYEVNWPDFVFRWIAIAFPWMEVICGGALLADFWPETFRLLAVAMCLVFVLMLGQAVLRGLDLKCGCFGTGRAGWLDQPFAALLRAGAMLAASGWLWLKSMAPRK